MGLVLSIVSVLGEEPERICKFCYGGREDTGADLGWLHPCRCSGTLHWVHDTCFELWMSRASSQQQLQCQTCRYVYQKSWMLKPIVDWCLPDLRMSAWQIMELLLDTYSTYKFLRGFVWMMEGKRSFFFQCVHFFFWRTFIMSDRRISYYTSLGRTSLSALFDVQVQNYSIEQDEEMYGGVHDSPSKRRHVQNRFIFDIERNLEA